MKTNFAKKHEWKIKCLAILTTCVWAFLYILYNYGCLSEFKRDTGKTKGTTATILDNSLKKDIREPSEVGASAFHRQLKVKDVINKTKNISWKKFCLENQKDNISFATYADKIGVKKIVKDYGLNIKIPETYAVVTNPYDISLDMMNSLPLKYVFKANHGCKMTIIVNGNSYRCYGFCKRLNYTGSSRELQLKFLQDNCHKWLSIDFGKYNNETFYSSIIRKCFFEEFIPQNDDYKIYVFHGKPGLFDVHIDLLNLNHQAFYTPSWNKVNMKQTDLPQTNVKKPIFLDEMLKVSEYLSRDFVNFVRVDLYMSNDDIVFSEFSMAPTACTLTFTPSIADRFYGLLAVGGNENPENIISLLEENDET